MKALVYEGPKKVRLKDIPKPNIGEDEVLVKVKYAGICATDIRIYKGEKEVPYPRVLGHEFAGIIEEVGRNVSPEYKPGERVTVYPMISCGECYACKAGRKNICVNRKTIGYEYDGGFAEYVRVPAKAIQMGNLIKLPENVSYKEGAISEPLAAAYNGIIRANIKEGDTVVIIGAGPIGLTHVQLALTKKPKLVIVSEPEEKRRHFAKLLGADIVMDPSKDSLEELVKRVTGNEGADVVLLDVSLPKLIEETIDILKKGGTYVIFAGGPEGNFITIDPNKIHYKEINLTGASASTPTYHREVIRLLANGDIKANPLISDIFLLEEWEIPFRLKSDFQSLKPLFKIDTDGDEE